MKAYIYYSRIEGGNVRTTDYTKANNEAYHSNSEVDVVNSDNVVVDTFRPTRIITTNLIDGGFHNPQTRNNA